MRSPTVIDQILAVLSAGNILASVVAGLLSGAWLDVFHPTNPIHGHKRRSVLQVVFFALPFSILYFARILFAITAQRDDIGRVVGGWILTLLFCVLLGVGAYLTGRYRQKRSGAK